MGWGPWFPQPVGNETLSYPQSVAAENKFMQEINTLMSELHVCEQRLAEKDAECEALKAELAQLRHEWQHERIDAELA